MKHKFKVISIISILCVIICISVTGCKTRYWEINHSVEEISSISIVEIDYLNEKLEFDCKVLSEIDKQFYGECVNDILSLEAHKYFPSPTYPQGTAFKITFTSGEYDLIAEWEPQHWTLDKDGNISCNRISWLHFNEEQFNQLIEKWTNCSN